MSKQQHTETSPPPVRMWLGNRAAVEVIEDATALAAMSDREIALNGVPKTRRPIPVAKAATFISFQPGIGLVEALQDLARLWKEMSDAPAPAWVASTNTRWSEFVAEHFASLGHEVEVREPEDPEQAHGPYVLTDDAAPAEKG